MRGSMARSCIACGGGSASQAAGTGPRFVMVAVGCVVSGGGSGAGPGLSPLQARKVPAPHEEAAGGQAGIRARTQVSSRRQGGPGLPQPMSGGGGGRGAWLEACPRGRQAGKGLAQHNVVLTHPLATQTDIHAHTRRIHLAIAHSHTTADLSLMSLRLDPGHERASFWLAAVRTEMGETAEVPVAAPADYVSKLFDGYAPRFDEHLTQQLGYRTPRLLMDLILASLRSSSGGEEVVGFESAVDLGCGTGLSGEALRPHVTGGWVGAGGGKAGREGPWQVRGHGGHACRSAVRDLQHARVCRWGSTWRLPAASCCC